MSEDASNPSIENQEVENIDSQVESLTENFNITILSDSESALDDRIPGMNDY